MICVLGSVDVWLRSMMAEVCSERWATVADRSIYRRSLENMYGGCIYYVRRCKIFVDVGIKSS